MEKLTIQEEEVMLYIWSIGDCFVKEIVSKFPDPKPPYTTVASIVNNLKRKGYVLLTHLKHLPIYSIDKTKRIQAYIHGRSSTELLCQLLQGDGVFLCQRTKDFGR